MAHRALPRTSLRDLPRTKKSRRGRKERKHNPEYSRFNFWAIHASLQLIIHNILTN